MVNTRPPVSTNWNVEVSVCVPVPAACGRQGYPSTGKTSVWLAETRRTTAAACTGELESAVLSTTTANTSRRRAMRDRFDKPSSPKGQSIRASPLQWDGRQLALDTREPACQLPAGAAHRSVRAQSPAD